MAKERKGYRRVRKGQGYVDRRSYDRDVLEKVSKGLPKKRKGGFFNPKAKIDRSQIQVRKSKDPTPYHWRTNKTKRDMALAKRHRLEEKADLDRDRQWKKGQIDWRWHQYEATTGYDKYRYGKDLKKKYPAVGKAKKMRMLPPNRDKRQKSAFKKLGKGLANSAVINPTKHNRPDYPRDNQKIRLNKNLERKYGNKGFNKTLRQTTRGAYGTRAHWEGRPSQADIKSARKAFTSGGRMSKQDIRSFTSSKAERQYWRKAEKIAIRRVAARRAKKGIPMPGERTRKTAGYERNIQKAQNAFSPGPKRHPVTGKPQSAWGRRATVKYNAHNMNKAMSAFNPRKKQIKKAAVKRYRGASSSTSKRAI